MPNIAVVYHSGFGHTQKVAEHVTKGVQSHTGAHVDLISVDQLGEKAADNWAKLAAADGIIFGAPTYMGGVSAPFKAFIDAASKVWAQQGWKDKTAAGFTNSGSYSGDKLSSLIQLLVNAMQHGMIWIGTGMVPGGDGKSYAGPEIVNRISSYTGLMTQSLNDSPEVTPGPGDLKTAELFGARFAAITEQFVRGRKS